MSETNDRPREMRATEIPFPFAMVMRYPNRAPITWPTTYFGEIEINNTHVIDHQFPFNNLTLPLLG